MQSLLNYSGNLRQYEQLDAQTNQSLCISCVEHIKARQQQRHLLNVLRSCRHQALLSNFGNTPHTGITMSV